MTPNYDYSRIITYKGSALMGATSNDIRALLEQDHSEKMLAASMAAVSNQTGYIHHDINDPDIDDTIREVIEEQFDTWWELERELVTRISNILICENPEIGIPENTGYHFIIQPFMERNGYRDGSGWWIKEAVVVDEFHIEKYTILVLDQIISTKKHDTYMIDGIAYTPVHLHIRPISNEPILNHIAIESAGSFLGKMVRFEMKHATQLEVENDE